MKHMIYTRPEVEKQLANFKCDQELQSEIHDLLENGFDELRILRIESERGNGSSHLLQAIANELRRKGEKLSYLRFKEGDLFSHLTPYHLGDLLHTRFLFIDELPLMLCDHSKTTFESFLHSFASQNGVLFYSSTNLGDQEEIRSICDHFQTNGITLTLSPIDSDLRMLWATELLGEDHVQEVPEEVFLSEGSNQEFLNKLEPHREKALRMQGKDHTFNRNYLDRLNRARLQLRQHQLKLAELQFEKDECIRKQLYEAAADIRERERSILSEIYLLQQEVVSMKNELPFIPNLLDLHLRTLVLLQHFLGEKSALDQLNKRMTQQIQDLSDRWVQLKENEETRSNRKVIEELRDWQEAMERFKRQFSILK